MQASSNTCSNFHMEKTGWILQVFTLTGIDTKTFSGNSIRSTLSPKTKAKGIPTKENSLRKFGLNITTCEKFYHKDILEDDIRLGRYFMN